MTDARFPERWLNDRRVLRLSDGGFRLFVVSLAWSVSNRTDGVLYDDDFELMMRVTLTHAPELVEQGLWRREADHWFIEEFDRTQTTRDQLEGLDQRRAADARRARSYRLRKKAKPSRDTSRDDKGQDRLGQARRFGGQPQVNGREPAEWSTPRTIPGGPT